MVEGEKEKSHLQKRVHVSGRAGLREQPRAASPLGATKAHRARRCPQPGDRASPCHGARDKVVKLSGATEEALRGLGFRGNIYPNSSFSKAVGRGRECRIWGNLLQFVIFREGHWFSPVCTLLAGMEGEARAEREDQQPPGGAGRGWRRWSRLDGGLVFPALFLVCVFLPLELRFSVALLCSL